MKNIDTMHYEFLIINYNDEIEELLKNSLQKILNELNLQNVYDDSIQYYEQ